MKEIKNTKAADTNESKSKKGNRASVVINIVTGIILALAVMFLVEALYANKYMHNNYFGNAVLPVASESMNVGGNSIKKGDLIFVKILDKDKKAALKEGDIITFKYFIHELDAEKLVTHRIQEIDNRGFYVTHGDANSEGTTENVSFDSVVGVYKSKIGGIGNIGLFFETKVGSFVMVVVPFLILLLLSAFQLIRNLRVYNKQKIDMVTETARSSALSEEKERMRQEILAELEKEKGKKGNNNGL